MTLFDLIGLTGVALITYGISTIYLPAAPIFAGLFLLFIGFYGDGFQFRRRK